MSSTSSSFSRRSYYPTIDPNAGHANIEPERLAEIFQFPDMSDHLMLFVPYATMWTPSSRTWGDTLGDKAYESVVQQNRQLVECFLFWVQIIKDLHVDIADNTKSVPAMIVLTGDVPSSRVGDPPVGMCIWIILQGVRHMFRPNADTGELSDAEHEDEKLVDDEAEEAGEEEEDMVVDDEDPDLLDENSRVSSDNNSVPGRKRKRSNSKKKKKAKKPKKVSKSEQKRIQKKREEAMKKMLKTPSVYRGWYDWLRNNETLDSEKSMANITLPNERGMGRFSKQHATGATFEYTGMKLRQWRTLCEIYSGRPIDIDEVAATFSDPLSARTGELGSVNPAEVFTIQRFADLCQRHGSDPAYWNMDNYPNDLEGTVNLPISADGLSHFYRVSHEDMIAGKAGRSLWNQFFPHIPQPNLADHAGVKAYNMRNGRPDGTIDDACRRAFMQHEDTNLYTADQELSKSLRVRFAKAKDECAGDQVELRKRYRQIQVDGLNKMHSYYQRSSKLPRADLGVMDWGDDFLVQTGGVMHWQLEKSASNLDWFGSMMDHMNNAGDHMCAIKNLHREWLLVWLSLLGVQLNRELHFNILFAGGPGAGKSYLYKRVAATAIKNTTNMLHGTSENYDTDGTNTMSNSVEINEEMQGSRYGARGAGGNGKGNGSSDREAATKSKMTAGKNNKARLNKNKDTDEWETKVYETICNNAYWIAMNGCPHIILPPAILNRNHVITLADRFTDEYRDIRSMTTDDMPAFTDAMDQVAERFRFRQYLFARVARVLNSGILPSGVNLKPALHFYNKVTAPILAKGGRVAARLDNRFTERYMYLCTVLCILHAISIVFESTVSDEKGRKFTDESILKVEPYLVCEETVAQFAWGLMSDCIEPEVERQVLVCLRDSYMRIGPKLTEDELNEAFGPSSSILRPSSSASRPGGVSSNITRSVSEIPDIHIPAQHQIPSSVPEVDPAIREAARRARCRASGVTQTTTTPSGSHEQKRSDEIVNRKYVALSTTHKDHEAKVVDNGFYAVRPYDVGKIFRNNEEREISVAESICALIGNSSISSDDVRGVLRDFSRHMIPVPGTGSVEAAIRTKKRGRKPKAVHTSGGISHGDISNKQEEDAAIMKPALVFGHNDLSIATSVLESLNDVNLGERILGGISDALCPMQVHPRYDTMVGWMDYNHTTRFRVHKFKHMPSSGTSVVAMPKFLCPASHDSIINMIRKPSKAAPRLDDAFDAEPVLQIDDNFFDVCVKERIRDMGLTFADFNNKPHPLRHVFNDQVDEASDLPLCYTYPNKYLDMEDILTRMRSLLTDPLLDTKTFIATVRSLPNISPNMDKAKKDILRLHSTVPSATLADLRHILANVVSLKKRSIAVSRIVDT